MIQQFEHLLYLASLNHDYQDLETSIPYLYYSLYNKFPHEYWVRFMINDNKTECVFSHNEPKKENKFYESISLKLLEDTLGNSFTQLDSHFIWIKENIIILADFFNYSCRELYLYTTDTKYVENLVNMYFSKIKFSKGSEQPCYYYVTYINNGFSVDKFNVVNNYNINIKETYNDDLPYEELKSFCNTQANGLSLLYGTPGTGKTTLIKSLIQDCKDQIFYLIDSSLLDNITNKNFISFLLQHSNSIFVLEDCEKLIIDRDVKHNNSIGTLLNLTDGLLGEGLSIRFICTFNTNLKNIDKALLRPGRLKIAYEFTPLVKEKAFQLCQKANVEYKNNIVLAEIYKSKIDCKKQNKLGF